MQRPSEARRRRPAGRRRLARRGLIGATAAVLLLVASGCGNRLPYDKLAADARGNAGASAANDQTAIGTNGAASTAPGATSGAATSGGATSGGTGTAAAGAVAAGASRAGGVAATCTGNESPIVIGSVGEQSGPIGSIIRTGPQAVQAWVAMINARGGLACHRVKYIVVDDGGDPARNQSLTQQLVEQDHVIAFVHSDAPLAGQASVAYLTQKRIPSIGNEGASAWFNTSPYYFTQAATGDTDILAAIGGVAVQAKAKRLSKVAVISCIEAAICSNAYDNAPAAAQRFGVDLVYRAKVSLVQPDFTSTCQAMQSAGTQVVMAAIDGNSYNRLARSCSSVNFHPVYGTGGPIASNSVVQDPTLDGLLLGTTVIAQTFTSNPGVAEFQTAVQNYAPGVPMDGAAITGWVSAKLFEAAAQHLSEPATSQDILNGLWSISNNDLSGMTGPLTFIRGQATPPTLCFFQAFVSHAKVVAANNGERTCQPL
jgi:branched-chain amino acid transport system substrate-binding protein